MQNLPHTLSVNYQRAQYSYVKKQWRHFNFLNEPLCTWDHKSPYLNVYKKVVNVAKLKSQVPHKKLYSRAHQYNLGTSPKLKTIQKYQNPGILSWNANTLHTLSQIK